MSELQGKGFGVLRYFPHPPLLTFSLSWNDYVDFGDKKSIEILDLKLFFLPSTNFKWFFP